MVFKDTIEGILEDESNLHNIINNSYIEFPEWDYLKTRLQGGSGNNTKSIAEHTVKLYDYIFKGDGRVDYQNLNPYSKKVLKLAILLHDIDKKIYGDRGHEIRCASKAKELMERWDYEPNGTTVNLVYTLVKYHPAIGCIADMGKDSGYSMDEIADAFKALDSQHAKTNIELLRLLNKSDMSSIVNKNGQFYDVNDCMIQPEVISKCTARAHSQKSKTVDLVTENLKKLC
jgi:hypothetical protein